MGWYGFVADMDEQAMVVCEDGPGGDPIPGVKARSSVLPVDLRAAHVVDRIVFWYLIVWHLTAIAASTYCVGSQIYYARAVSFSRRQLVGKGMRFIASATTFYSTRQHPTF